MSLIDYAFLPPALLTGYFLRVDDLGSSISCGVFAVGLLAIAYFSRKVTSGVKKRNANPEELVEPAQPDAPEQPPAPYVRSEERSEESGEEEESNVSDRNFLDDEREIIDELIERVKTRQPLLGELMQTVVEDVDENENWDDAAVLSFMQAFAALKIEE